MDMSIDENTVREMAGRLRTAVGHELLSHSKAIEAVAQGFGYPNWDTLCAKLKQEHASSFILDAPVPLFVACYSCDDHGENPIFAEVEINQDLIDRLSAMHQLVRTKKIEGVTETGWPQHWGQIYDGDPRMECGKLHVTEYGWYFSGQPRHCTYTVETRMIDLPLMLTALKTRKDSVDGNLRWVRDVLLYDESGEPDMLRTIVEQDRLSADYLGGIA